MTIRLDRRSLGLGLALAGLGLVGRGRAAPSGLGPAGALRHYIADLKPSFPEHPGYSGATALTDANHRAVLDGLRSVGVNGLRVPVVPSYADAGSYPSLHGRVLDRARGLGFTIYASPLSVGMRDYPGWSDERYASWLAAYASGVGPDVLSPFNEAALDDRRMASIVGALRSDSRATLAGPDRQHVDRTLRDLSADPGVEALFDIVTSHNADRDASATAANWGELVRLAGGTKPVWSSENPAGWSHGVGGLPGIDQAVAGGVQGLVVWMAKPGLVDDGGRPTAKARDIAAHILA